MICNNVQANRQSLTKKILQYERQQKPFKTIQSLEKQPTQKKLTNNNLIKKDSHLALQPPKLNQPSRKVKSLSKPQQRHINSVYQHLDINESNSKRHRQKDIWAIQNSIQPNSKIIRFSVSRERGQKYKRSQEVKSVLERKKMSSLSKIQRKNTEDTTNNIYKNISNEKKKIQVVDTDLNSIINMSQISQGATLQNIFEQGCHYYRIYKQKKPEKQISETISLKQTNYIQLQQASKRFSFILKQVGQRSMKNILMIGLIKYEQAKYVQCIMYLSKLLQKLQGNLFKIQTLNCDQHKNNKLCKQLNLLGYLILAEAYQKTKNYLCAINVLQKWQNTTKINNLQINFVSIKNQYQTIQSKQSQQNKESRMKKKSYILGAFKQQATASKLKKYSHAHNYSSIQLTNKNQQQIHNKNKLNQDSLKYQKHVKQWFSMYLLLGRLHVKIKSYDLALNYYKKCIKNNAYNIEACLQLASLYYFKYGALKSINWLDQTLARFTEGTTQKRQLDISYVKYHKSLILYQQNELDQSLKLLLQIKAQQLHSQVSYYKGSIRLKKMKKNLKLNNQQRKKQIQRCLMEFNDCISAFTSRQYLFKAYFQIILVLIFQNKDYYGAQYEINRLFKVLPSKKSYINQFTHEQFYEDSNLDIEQSLNSKNEGMQIKVQFLLQLIEGIICILKMKIKKGLNIFKDLSLKIQNQNQDISLIYGLYYYQIHKLLLQFKFYAYYIQREYQLSLKQIIRLITLLESQHLKLLSASSDLLNTINSEIKMVTINKLMLQCMILMKQTKYNYAMSKLTQMQTIAQINQIGLPISSPLISNNYHMIKALCLINLYAQLQQQKITNKSQNNDENDREILLSAEQLLRHCLMSDKQNSLIYYLISVIHYQLQQYESSLKYIRQALQFSDDHMIKHYFSKANSKAMLNRYQQAIKDYSNAVVVYKQQIKNQSEAVSQQQEYYHQTQIMYPQIYLNRAICYLKLAYQTQKDHINYLQNYQAITTYRIKATDDLVKYFDILQSDKINLDKTSNFKNYLSLFYHCDDPSQMIQTGKKLYPRLKLLEPLDQIHVYYITKQLNNCIQQLQSYTNDLKNKQKQQNNKLINSQKKKKMSQQISLKELSKQDLHLRKMQIDLKCLKALKKSSIQTSSTLQQALVQLLQLTQQIYKKKQQQLNEDEMNLSLEQMFQNYCGAIFKWSDILFFIGVIHFELQQYQTAIKYFEQSYNQKKNSKKLISLVDYTDIIIARQQPTEQQLFSQLQSLFQNRTYCKQQIQYNIGLCYLFLGNKLAYQYLQDYPLLLNINILQYQKNIKNKQIYIADSRSQSQSLTKRQNSYLNLKKQSLDLASSRSIQSRQKTQQSEADSDSQIQKGINITPFPTHNRLCSIYSPKILNDKKIFLSFCLPQLSLPKLRIFQQQQIKSGKIVDISNRSLSSLSSLKQNNIYSLKKDNFQSVLQHISLIDLQMKPIAPWIRQNNNGIVFTDQITQKSVQINSERQKKTQKQQKKKKDRYGSSKSRQQL